MKMKKYILLGALVGLAQGTWAQSWVSNAKKAVFSIVTYDKDGNILNNGNGFYIGTDGTALSDYKLFKGAYKATVIDADGQKNEVSYILGANDMYDVVKFKVNNTKKISALTLATGKAAAGQNSYILPYSTQKNVTPLKGSISAASDVAESYKFYTIGKGIEDNNVSCPVLNDAGQVIGIIQKGDANESYAMDSQYANALTIAAFSANDYTLNSINIAKDLPEKSEDALVYCMMKGNESSIVEQLINKFPDMSEGYFRRATNYVDNKEYTKADQDLQTYLEKSDDKAEAYYQISKLIYNACIYQNDMNYEAWSLEKALDNINKTLEIGNLPIYTKHKADVNYALGKYEEAYKEYESIIGTELKAEELYSYMADCKAQQNASHDEIIALLDSAVAVFSKPYPNEAAPYLYARALKKTAAEKYRDAVNDFNDVEHIYGGRANAEFYYNREQAEKSCKMYQQAMQDINEALELAPNDIDIMVEHASLYILLKNYETSKATAEKMIAQYPDEALGYRFLGFSQAMLGQKAEAKKNLQKAKDMGDENAETIMQKYCK